MEFIEEYNDLRNESLAEDIIKRLREIERHMVTLKPFVRTSMGRGFERSIVDIPLPLIYAKMGEMIKMGETLTEASNSKKSALMKAELASIKSSLELYVKTFKELIMTEPTKTENLEIFKRRNR